ncbi:MAG: ABC transporter ATP-binding protein [Ruminococcus sp.]|uniref:ABC transporter ATP-binding protein n=1 Tax=Ruminococcus sp. TaxID=41978 RepID=UPI00287375F9|nr:ABC transporter ATP-binding protein [Ruminococcus sp.]MBQ3284337.1 ABC transporter ATP-binding protein [Ruminococcus sp.]
MSLNNMNRPGEPGERVAPAHPTQTVKRMFRYLIKSRKLIIGMLALLAAATVFNLFIPDLIGRAIDTLNLEEGQLTVDWKSLLILLGVLLAVFLLSSLFQYLQGRLAAKLTKTTVVTIRKDVAQKLIRLPVAYFDNRQNGDILARLTNDVENVSNLISTAIAALLSSVIVIVGCIVIMLIKSPILTAVCLSTVVLNILVTLILSKKMFGYFRKQQKAVGKMNSHVEQSVANKRTIDAYDLNEEVVAECDSLSDELTEVGIRAQVLGGAMPPLMCLIGNLNFLLIVAVGALMFIHGGFGVTIGTIQAFTLYSRQFTQPINELSGVFSQFMTALASAERIFEIIDTPSEADEGTTDVKPSGACEIVFEHVTFSYIRGVKVLDDFSLTIEKGQKVALVGKTGVGKTTLISLLLRFYEPDSGRILIDGADIRTIPKSRLRSMVTAVLQSTAVIEGTVRENIAYSRFTASEDEIRAAAEISCAAGFIERMENGYDTVVTGEDTMLSQGERQLLCLARSSLTAPSALVLDEALSSVDSATEQKIQDALLSMMEDQTCIIIAHRLSTVINADKIAVFSDGKIAETGKHQELLNKHGVYYSLYKNQYVGILD